MDLKTLAASLFRVQVKHVDAFERKDPFNEPNVVRGFINRRKGLMGGSLVITHVNGKEVEPQLIYGTPKLVYPYLNESRQFLSIKASKFLLAEKWNGVNICSFSYKDSSDKYYLSHKTKGAPFVSDSEHGKYLTLFTTALKDLQITCNLYSHLATPGIETLSSELCGRAEPHLVRYNFSLDVKPLFVTGKNGKIKPVLNSNSKIFTATPEELIKICQESQAWDFKMNERFRQENGFAIKYEYNHFATEGKVLYPLDEHGFVLGRVLFKIKPKDVEELHWARFDRNAELRVEEAIIKLLESNCPLNPESLADELDMGPKEWGKWGKHCLAYCEKQGYKVDNV